MISRHCETPSSRQSSFLKERYQPPVIRITRKAQHEVRHHPVDSEVPLLGKAVFHGCLPRLYFLLVAASIVRWASE